MRTLSLLITIPALLLFTGCSLGVQPENLSPDEKRLLYHSVQDEIEQLSAEGERLYDNGYFADAAEAFELVNFYEDRTVIPTARIRKIRIRANANGRHYYDKAERYIKQDKKRALLLYNRMMRNDPDYKDGRERFETLKDDPEIRPFLANQEARLQKALENNMGSARDYARIDAALEALTEYDDSNPVAQQAKALIKKRRSTLLSEGIRLYNRGAYTRAAERFKLVRSIRPEDRTAEKYLTRIRTKNELGKLLKKARIAMKQKEYGTAYTSAEQVLGLDAHNSEAKRIARESKAQYEKQIPELISRGIAHYGRQEFDKALSAFQAVLLLDPDNNTPLTYIRKIERQLATIKSLE